MLYLVEQFDDIYLQKLVDILHKDVEKYLELFSRFVCFLHHQNFFCWFFWIQGTLKRGEM